MKIKCGDANPSGNIRLTYRGGCREELKIIEAYRCVGCGGWFHFDCILKHFELEKNHDHTRYFLKKIQRLSKDKNILKLCEKGLKKIEPLDKYALPEI